MTTTTTHPAARFLDRAVYVLLPAALLGPVFYLPRMIEEPFKVPAEAWIVTASWVLAAVVGVARALEGRRFLGGAEGSLARRLLMALLGWALLTSFLGVAPAASLSYFATLAAYLVGAQSVLGWLEEAPARRPWLFALIAALVGLEAFIGMVQFFKVPLDAWAKSMPANGLLEGWFTFTGLAIKSGDPIGTLGNRNYLAELLCLGLPIALVRALDARTMRGRLALGGVAALGLVTMIACGTRAAALGFVVGGVIAALLAFGPSAFKPAAWWGNARARVALVLGALIVMAGVAVAGDRLVDKLNRPITTDLGEDARVVNWNAAAGVWKDHAILGTGLGGYKILNVPKLAEQNPQGLPATISNARFYQAHSEPLQGLAELGLGGALLLLGALLAWVREVRRNASLPALHKLGLLWGVAAVVVASCFGFPFHIALTAFAFLLIIAAGLAGATGALPEAASAEAAADVPVEAAYVSPVAVAEPPADEAGRLPAGQRPVYAGLVLAVTLFAGAMAISHGVGPLMQASHYRWLGNQVDQKAKKVIGADVLFELAARHDRFPAPHVFEELQALLRKKRYKDIIAVSDRYKDVGLGRDAMLIRAAALEYEGRKDEAIPLYKNVMAFYHNKHRNYRSARRRLKRLGIAVPDLPKRSPAPGASAAPTAAPGGSAAPSVAPSAAASADAVVPVPDRGAGAPARPKSPAPSP